MSCLSQGARINFGWGDIPNKFFFFFFQLLLNNSTQRIFEFSRRRRKWGVVVKWSAGRVNLECDGGLVPPFPQSTIFVYPLPISILCCFMKGVKRWIPRKWVSTNDERYMWAFGPSKLGDERSMQALSNQNSILISNILNRNPKIILISLSCRGFTLCHLIQVGPKY